MSIGCKWLTSEPIPHIPVLRDKIKAWLLQDPSQRYLLNFTHLEDAGLQGSLKEQASHHHGIARPQNARSFDPAYVSD